MADIYSALQIYNAVYELASQANLADVLEPEEHVIAVEILRQSHRPQKDVRLLIIGESHVRISPERFRQKGPAYIYNERYYTSWWRHLLLPAFAPAVASTNCDVRRRLLNEMQNCGVWILDASLISLSGYAKVESRWGNRPLDAIRKEILQLSWFQHVGRQVEELMKQDKPPVVCALSTVSDVVLKSVGAEVIWLRCVERSNGQIYGQPGYPFGTHSFVRAVSRALA